MKARCFDQFSVGQISSKTSENFRILVMNENVFYAMFIRSVRRMEDIFFRMRGNLWKIIVLHAVKLINN